MIKPEYWLIFGVILIIVEMFTPTFAILWFGVSAVAIATLTWTFEYALDSWQMQISLWIILSVLITIFWFKVIQPIWEIEKKHKGLKNGDLINEKGVIIKVPTATKAGVIRFHVPICGDTEWKCLPENSDETINIGDKVKVVDVAKNELLVRLYD